jgi:serine/threonine protein kinase
MFDAQERLKAALADRYLIERELGRGGMAIVYLAHDQKLGRDIALKVLRAELAASLGADRFLREIEIAAKLTHPNILALHDCGEADGQLYYTMPFVEGESLRDRLTGEKQLSIVDALQVTKEVADALGHAHSLGIVHRDIKPENILFQSGHAVVSDFGIAKAVDAASYGSLTGTGLSVGTPAYMSPEQAASEPQLDGRTDIFSLGCVLYEMLAGEPPFTGPTAQAIIAKRLSGPAPSVLVLREAVPPEVEAAVRKALNRTPADRYATMRQFVEALSGKPPARAAFAVASGAAAGARNGGVIPRALIRLIGRSRLSMKNGISYLSFQTSDEVVDAINDIARRIPRDSDEVFFVNQGGGEITIICEAEKEKLLDTVRYRAVDYRPGVGILRIQEPREPDIAPGIEVPGLYAYFINELADNGINILDMVSTRTQLTVIVADGDLTSAFSVLSERIRQHRSESQSD